MVYFTSDAHYGHKNICKGVSEWVDDGTHEQQRTRDFNTLEEMNDAIVNGINSVVDENDELYYLGDWSFGGIQNIWEFRKRIKCKNIYLILGNHDHHIENNRVLSNTAWKIEDSIPSKLDKNIDHVRSQELFKSVSHIKTVTINKHTFFLSHYAHRVWNKSHHGVIHLYGHSHNTIDNTWGKSMDVGIDAVFALKGKYRPLSVTEILEIMGPKNIQLVDHHNQHTN